MPGLTMIMSPEQDFVPKPTAATPIKDVVSQLASMQRQESTSYQCRDYLDAEDDGARRASSPPPCRRRRCSERSHEHERVIDRDARSKMVEWSHQVNDFFKFQRETVAMATNYLDRFLATSNPRACRALRCKKEFQLASMTTLYIAIKLFEPLAVDAELLAQISHGCYLADDITEMEEEILTSLSWRMNGPTAHAFIGHIMALLPPSAYARKKTTVMTLLDFSTFQADIAVTDYDLALQKPSAVALAAIMNSIEGVEEHLFPARCRYQFLQLIARETGMNPFSIEINAVRARLLKLFSKNSGYELPQVANLTPVVAAEQCFIERKLSKKISFQHTMPLPGSVVRQFATEPGTYGAKCA